MNVWRYNPAHDPIPELAEPGDLVGRRAVLVAAPPGEDVPRAWLAIDDYNGPEGTVLFGATPGDEYRAYIRALLGAGINEARLLGFTSLLAHWRGGWTSAEPALHELGFTSAGAGFWRRFL